jgi:hypothetical protein
MHVIPDGAGLRCGRCIRGARRTGVLRSQTGSDNVSVYSEWVAARNVNRSARSSIEENQPLSKKSRRGQ